MLEEEAEVVILERLDLLAEAQEALEVQQEVLEEAVDKSTN
jgi:hypothetical protein